MKSPDKPDPVKFNYIQIHLILNTHFQRRTKKKPKTKTKNPNQTKKKTPNTKTKTTNPKKNKNQTHTSLKLIPRWLQEIYTAKEKWDFSPKSSQTNF